MSYRGRSRPGRGAAIVEPTRTVHLPPQIPPNAILGKHGKVVKRLKELSGASISYFADDHRVDIKGRTNDVGVAAQLVERTIQNFQYSGLQFGPKQVHSILGDAFQGAEEVQLLPGSRPVATVIGSTEGVLLAPLPPSSTASSRQQPGASTSSSPLSSQDESQPLPAGAKNFLLRRPSDLDASLSELLSLSTSVALEHPADCDSTEIRFYLGKLLLTDLTTSHRRLPFSALLDWTFPANGRAVFDTSLPQDTIRSLDSYLTSSGFTPTQQSKSASLHLETSIPWIQYHPTFSVADDASGLLRLSKLEALGCKPLTLAMVGPPDQLDLRARFVAGVQHAETDGVAAELRHMAEEGQFALLNGVQVTVPRGLRDLDLTLTSARVKLKRTYLSSGPLPPPLPPSTPAAAGRKARTRRTAAAEAAPLPAVTLKVSVAAVVDNLGGRRLEVTASCPELNAQLMAMHRSRAEGPGERALLEGRLRAVLAHLDSLRRGVAFVP